jgi:hypothetical protein
MGESRTVIAATIGILGSGVREMAEAYYRLEAKVIQRSKGQSSVAAAAYNAGEKLIDERTGITHDYTRKTGIYHTAILTPEGAPEWANDRRQLWNKAEAFEKRKDSQVGRHFILSFSTALTPEENIALSKQFLQEEFVDKGFATDVAYHDFTGKNAHNPHAHVLVTSRAVLDKGFCSFKDRSWNRKEKLLELREKWAAIQNRYFEQQGRSERVDHRSYKDQGLNRVPEVHEGKAVSAIRQKIARGERKDSTDLIDLNNEIRQLNAKLEQEKTTLADLKAKAAREQDNQKIARITKDVLAVAKPTLQELKAAAQHQAQREQFALDIGEIVQATKPHSAPKPKELASPSNTTQTPSKRGTMPPPPREPDDRTYRAVWRQLHAFDGDGMFEVGILDPDTGKMRNLTYHREALLKLDEMGKPSALSYLKAQNARGCHLYLRPAPHANGDTQGYVLIDDIEQVTAEELRDKGLPASLIVETSWKNCQAWVKVGDRLSRDEASQVAKLLTKEAGGDPASAAYQHYGRLAGFTNRKEEHLDYRTGQYPWVLVRHAERIHAPAGVDWVRRARKELEEEAKRLEEARALQLNLASKKATEADLAKALQAFAKYAAKTTTKDSSTRDWIALKSMAKRGYSYEALEHALWHSEGLEERKKGHTADYIQRTLAKLQVDPDVLQALHRRQENLARRAERKATRAQERDERVTIEQWQQYKERERDSPASSHSRQQEQMKPPGEARKMKSSPGKGNQNKMTKIPSVDDVAITPLAALTEEQVGWIVGKTLESRESQAQFRKAAWSLTQDTSKWQKVKAEYLKELARTVEVKGAQAYHPYTDAEIGVKLRMAGFGKQRIYDCLKENSPFASYLDDDAKTRYLYQGIAPLMDNPKVNQKIAQWNQFRTHEAIALPEDQREAYIKEHRLEELKLSITKERWQEQQGQHQERGSNQGRER